MNERRELDKVQSELEDKYGPERVVREPTLGEGQSLRPGILVFEDQDHTSSFLIIEYSSLSTPHRRSEDIEQVCRYIEATGASFGAVVSEDIRYIFRIDQHDELIEVPISGYPDIEDKSDTGPHPIGNYQMFQFLFQRVQDLLREARQSQISGEFPQQLFRKYESDRQGIPVQINDEFGESIQRLDTSIQQRHEAYDPEAAPIDSSIPRTIFRVLSDYDLTETSLSVRRQIVEDTFMSDFFDKEGAQFSTPPEVADILVELAEISDGETVLDPASGWGYTLRAANEHTENVIGVEIHSGINNAALFFNDLLEKTGDYINSDFLEMAIKQETQLKLDPSQNQGPRLPNNVEKIILDPPMGAFASEEVTGHIEESRAVRVEGAFVSLALDRLAEGGRLTAIIPTSVLFADRYAWLREKIVRDHTVQGIIEISDSDPFPYTSADLAIIIIDKIPEGVRVEFPGVVYDESPDTPTNLEQAVRNLQSQNAELIQVDDPSELMLPSELLGMRHAEYELSERFSELAPLDEVASGIDGGVHRDEEEREGNIPYLKLGADLDGPNTFTDSETPVAEETDLLVALKATPGKIYHPEQPVVPSSNLAIVRFPSEDTALVYGAFLSSELGHHQIESMARGATIQYVPLRRLGDVIVPVYSGQEIAEKADEIRHIREQQRVPEGEFNDDIDFTGVF